MKAMFMAEAIGWSRSRGDHYSLDWAERLPWLAQIVGLSARYGLDREFLSPKIDYSRANSKATRGVYYCWTLESGQIYETSYPVSWKRTERKFLTVTDDGEIVTITRQEVDAWLARRLNVSRIEPA